MNRSTALRLLGVSGKAPAAEIQSIYKQRVTPIKAELLAATRAADVARNRDELRQLVAARDIALGKKPRDDWSGQRLSISSGRLIGLLQRTSVDVLDKKVACAFFKLSDQANALEIQEAYGLRMRALIRRFACATEDSEMRTIRRARSKLRTIRNFALS